MLNELHCLVERARVLVGSFDPDLLTGPDARTAVELFVALEKFAAAGRLLAVGRLDETGAWFGDGTFRDMAAWLASISGTTVGAARGAADTARRLRELPASTDALRAGALSPAQPTRSAVPRKRTRMLNKTCWRRRRLRVCAA